MLTSTTTDFAGEWQPNAVRPLSERTASAKLPLACIRGLGRGGTMSVRNRAIANRWCASLNQWAGSAKPKPVKHT